MNYHSQNGEADIIIRYFNGFVGTLLSIGECDGITFSNSYDLIALGWKATLIEPIAQNFINIPTPEGVEKFNFAIGTHTGEAEFNVVPDGLLNSMLPDNIERFGLNPTTELVPVFTYADALEQFTNKAFNFITIDAEGMDWDILRQIDLKHTQCLCIEYGKYEAEIREYCKGWRVLHRNHENIIFTR